MFESMDEPTPAESGAGTGSPEDAPAPSTEGEVERLGRPRFVEATLSRQPGSRASVRVVLELGGRRYVSEASGVGEETMVLRLAAQAGLRALEEAIGRSDLFELIGVKRIHAFDETVVLTCVRFAGEPPKRLLGSVPAGHASLAEVTVLSLLKATNRIVEWLPKLPETEA